MLSYRHGFHAGNPADVLKHAVFLFVVRHLQKKDGPLLVLDTHAGAGVYDLTAPEAEKTGEYRDGILKVLARTEGVPALLADYLARVRAANPAGRLINYPGSPALAMAVKRHQDRLALYELHPADHAQLAALAGRRRGITVHREDGFTGLRAQLPPAGARGVALIDPSYEIKTDYEKAIKALAKAWRRFASGVYILWYPVIERARVDTMMAAIKEAGITKVYRLELGLAPDAPGFGMTGSGLIVVNAPFTLPAAAEAALPWLAAALDAKGPRLAEWLVAEAPH